MIRSLFFLAMALVLLAVAAMDANAWAAEPSVITFTGVARTGTDTRRVAFHFFCSSSKGPNMTGVLAVELEIPDYNQLHAVFNFDPFEGPDANAGPLTQLQTTGARTKATDRFTAAGSVIPVGSAEAFSLGVDASRRDPGSLHKLAAVLRPLTDGTGHLLWVQGNAKTGGTPIAASLELTLAQSDQLKTALGPCLGAR
jgi:hypothetical protein